MEVGDLVKMGEGLRELSCESWASADQVSYPGVYDVVPSSSNIHVWTKVETPACPLCSKHGTLEHSLSSYAKVFGESRYRWRHDQEEPGGVSGLELAVPWEDRLEEAFERKLSVSK